MIPYENLNLTNKMFEEEYKSAFYRFIDKGWYVLGEEVKNFENEFASYVGTKYCIGLASGLDALIIALNASSFLKEAKFLFLQTHTLLLFLQL